MINETEVKFSLGFKDKNEFINECIVIFPCLVKSESFQRDEYYDTVDMQLQNSDFVVRVRRKDNDIFVALKSPRIFVSDYIQKRIELEFVVGNDYIKEQIQSQGLIPIAIIEKKRTTLKAKDFTIEVDTLPYIGTYVEIESTTEKKVADVCSILSLNRFAKEKGNYGEILDRKSMELGLPQRPNLIATFENEGALYKNDN